MTEYLPRPPGVFLVPEARDIEIRNRRAVQRVDPDQRLPISVIVWMRAGIVPIRNLAMYVMVVDVRQRSKVQVPLVRIPLVERKIGVGKLVTLLHHRILKVVAEAKGTVAVVVVMHPFIDRTCCLLADGLQRRMRV